MGDTAISWLSDLNISIVNFEEDLSNGYLLGMILYRYNIQDDFGQFSNKQTYNLSNISKLQLSLEKLNIKFDPHRVINKEPGYSKKLLEKIHKALHNGVALIPKKNDPKIPSRPTKEQESSTKLKFFEDNRLKQAQKALEKEKNQNDQIFKSQMKERSRRIETLKANKTFIQTWQDEGKQKWLKNLQVKNLRVSHYKKIHLRLENNKKDAQKKYNTFHVFEFNEGVNEFEKNMVRLGIDYIDDTEKKVNKQDLSIEAAVTMAKIKENKRKSIEAAKEREIRQRNLHIEHKKNEKFELYKTGCKRIEAILNRIIVLHLKTGFSSVATLAKKRRRVEEVERNIKHYKKMHEERWGEVDKKYKDELEAIEQLAKNEIAKKRKQISINMIENRKKSYKKRLDLCRPIITDIMVLADQAYDFINVSPNIPPDLWNNWLDIFKTRDINPKNYKPLYKPTK